MAETIANLVKSLQEKISKFEGRPYSHSFTPLKVIVLGGAGYIGSAVVDHFSRAGHQVYAVVRSESHRAQIEKLEATVLIGNSQELETKFQDILDQADVVVDTVADNTDMETAIKSLNATIASAKRNPAKRKRFIMTSGCLIYQGKDPEQIFTETAVTDTPLLAGRVKTEKAVTESKDVDGIAMRVAFVYGGSHGHYGQGNWISGAFDEQGNSVVIGDPNKKYSWIHIHDLAEAYLRVAEAPAKVVSHQIYNISDDTNVSIKQLIEAGRALFPTKPGTGIIFKPAGTDFFSQLLETNARASHDKLAGHLGWHPRHIDMMQNLKLYAAGFKAHHARVAKAEHSSAQTAQEPLEKPKPKEEVKAAEPAKEEVKAAEPAKEEVKEQPKQEQQQQQQQQQQPKQQQQQQGGGKKKNRK